MAISVIRFKNYSKNDSLEQVHIVYKPIYFQWRCEHIVTIV